MANCSKMKEDDIYFCKNRGLELQVTRPCTCGSGSGETCMVPLKCCNQDMTKK